MTNSNAAPAVKLTIKGCLWITCGLIILEIKAENEPAICLPVYFKSVKKKNKTKQNKTKQNKPTKQKEKKSLLRRESNPGPSKCEANAYVNMHHDS